MAFGSEILLFIGAGFVVLGPKRMQSMIGQIGRAKAQFDKASRSFMSEVTSGLNEQLPAARGDGDNSRPQPKSALPEAPRHLSPVPEPTPEE